MNIVPGMCLNKAWACTNKYLFALQISGFEKGEGTDDKETKKWEINTRRKRGEEEEEEEEEEEKEESTKM